MNIWHKWLKRLIVIIPVTISIFSFATVCYLFTQIKLSKSADKNDFEINFDNIYEGIKIFPSLNKYDFYDDIKITQGKAMIDNDMIAKIINYIIDKIQIPYGAITYNFELNNGGEQLKLTFEWNSSSNQNLGKIYRQSYLIKISDIKINDKNNIKV